MQTYQAHADILAALLTEDPEQVVIAFDKHYAGLESRLARAQQQA